MFEANCLKERPARIVARVLEENTPCILSARKGEEAVLLPLGGEGVDELLHSHRRILNALVKDLKSSEMPLYCVQVVHSGERDAIRFIDGKGRAVLALVGARRFVEWLERAPKPRPARKKAAAKPRKKTAAKPRKTAAKTKKRS